MKFKPILNGLLLLYLVLGTWKGYVALFDRGDQEPRMIYPRTVDSLPAEDQAALEEGIIIRNQDQLEQALDKYVRR